jgi:hypothetical protein
MSKINSQSTYVQKPVPPLIWAMLVWSLQQMLCMVPMHFAQRCALCRKFLVSLEPLTHSLLGAVVSVSHWSALNTPKSLGIPKAKKSRGLRSGGRAGQLTGLRVLSTVNRKSGSDAVWQCGENEVVLHHAWTTCVVVDEEAHVPGVLVNRSPKNDGTLNLLVC